MSKNLLDSFLDLKCVLCVESEIKLEIKEGMPHCKICGIWDCDRLTFWNDCPPFLSNERKKRLIKIKEYLKRSKK